MKHLRLKKILSFLVILCCLAGSILPVSAAEEETTNEETTKVIFKNAENRTPDLYVTKQVETQTEGYEIPKDIRFSFVLRLDGELANARTYRVFDESGSEVYQYLSGGGLEESTEDKLNKVVFKTGRSGDFTLAPGQTAKFEFVGAGVAYEVRETPTEGWEQTRPAGGAAAVGTVTDSGAWATFVNTFGGKGGDASLKVKKTVSFPDGYKPPETPEFTFTLLLDNAPWKQEPYNLLDEDGELLENAVTDDAGSFTLHGGQTAVFTDIPENVDYKITESISEEAQAEGWRTTGDTVKEGSTGKGGGVTFLYFNNAIASFAVSKTMQDKSTPEKDFSFLLTDAGQTAMTGVRYYLYSTSGEAVTDTDGAPLTGETDETGHFTLKPGQTAIFYGVEKGTIYHVKEEAEPEYIQVVPSTSEGYSNKKVTDAVEVLPFVNSPSDNGGLTVTKLVKAMEGEAPLEQKEFTFVLRKAEEPADGSTVPGEKNWTPVAEAVYSVEIGTSQYTYKTDGEGQFTVKSNETARFTDLAPGEYQVEETKASLEYEPEQSIQEDTLVSVNEGLDFVFNNRYTTRLLDLNVIKQNRSGEALKGAKFMLYRDETLNNPVLDEPIVTDAEGNASIESLKPGTYYLVETEAPADYQLLAAPIVIKIEWVDNKMHVKVNDHIIGINADEQIHIELGQNGSHDKVQIKVYNSKGFTLPLTGSAGLVLLKGVLAAAAVLLAVLWYLGSRRRKTGSSQRNKGRDPKGIK